MSNGNPTSNEKAPFQRRVTDWMMETFSMEVTRDTTERNHRFLEEALELVQSLNCTRQEAHMLVDYVFGRPTGAPEQEVGGVAVTLAALCNAAGMDTVECAERELSRCWLNIDRIRAKQAGKPRNSPLPGPSAPETTETYLRREIDRLRLLLRPFCKHPDLYDGHFCMDCGLSPASPVETYTNESPPHPPILPERFNSVSLPEKASVPLCKCGRRSPHRFVEGECGEVKAPALPFCNCEGSECHGTDEATRWGHRCRADACKNSNQ